MNCVNKLIITLIAVTSVAACFAANTGIDERRHKEIIDSIQNELSLAKTSADSLPMLFDLYDLAPYGERYPIADLLYQTAVRAKNRKVEGEMCFRLADIAMTMRDPDLVQLQLERSERLPDSEDKEIIRCYIKTCVAPSKAFRNEQDQSETIRQLLEEVNDAEQHPTLNRYDRIAKLFNLAECIQGYTQGVFLTEFMDQLENELIKIPADKGVILRNKFYATAAMFYMRNEQFDKAIKADRKLLSVIDRMDSQNKETGRKFREFTVYRFISCRRMLKGYEYMSLAEVESIYDAIMEMAKVNTDIADDIEVNPVAQMVLHMKREEYDRALPLLKILTANAQTLYEKKYYLRQLIKAAEAVGDTEALTPAQAEYCKILEQYTDEKTAERTRELEINYNYQALRDRSEEEIRNRQKMVTTLAIVSSVLLVIVIIVLIISTTRMNKRKRKLAEVNANLRRESDELRKTTELLTAERNRATKAMTEKTQLVNYVTNEVIHPINSIIEYSQMLVDNAQGENKVYLERFKGIVNMNISLLQGLVADVQELGVAESGSLPVNITPVDLNALAVKTIENVASQVPAGVTLNFEPANGGGKFVFDTDPRRVEVVLLNLLTNAIKFTTSGAITLRLEDDREKSDAIFSVTDTGIGIPADKAESIFNRFEKLNPDVKGPGLGLNVCQLVAQALNADIALDTSYPGPGSRFAFTLHTPQE